MGTRYQFHFRCIFSVLFVLISIVVLDAQRTIHGKVTDADTGEGVIGANVVVKGSTVGTVTDFDGSYSLVVPAGFDLLSFSYTGYNTVEVQLSASDEVNVAIGQGQLLDEVVLIGYGTVKREDATGAVQSVTSEDFNKGAITGPQELLAGKIPGVVINTDPSPGGGATIRIRGESSLGASKDPLIVIDGVPIDNGAVSGGRNFLNVINPNDIESMTVLKDASASAIYGNRASGGVILITTKKGKAGDKFRVAYSGNVSVSNTYNLVDALDADEFRAVMYSRFDSSHNAIGLMRDANTNWQEEIYQSGIGHDHNLYFSGGLPFVPYRLSLGYTEKEGILRTDKFDRITAGLNLNPGFIDNTLQINLNFKSMFGKNHFADRGAIGNALNFDPTQPVYDTLSPYGGYRTWTIANGNPNTLAPTNPVALLDLRDDDSKETRFLTNLIVDYRMPFLPALRANLNLGYDYALGEGTVVVPTNAAFAFDAINGGGVNNVYEQTKKNSLLEFYLNYKEEFGRSDLDIMGGYSWQHFEVDNSFTNSDAAGTPSETTRGADPAELFLLSLFGRINYGFDDKYLLTFTLRRDGTSRFSPETRWGLFPAAAAAVKVFDNDRNSFNSLKLRAGWGITGQQDIGDYYSYLARYQLGDGSARYQFGDEFINTLRPNGYDANIRWEETETYNLGGDFSIIRDRLSGSLDLYKRFTTDLLNYIPVPAGTNLTNFINTNVGNMETEGFEVGLNMVPVHTQKVFWEMAVNVAYNKSEITKLTATNDPTYAGVSIGDIAGGVGSTIQIHSVGYAPQSFYVYEQMYDENGNILENMFVDRNSDGIINGLDRYRFEDPAPDYTFGLSSRVGIGNFDVSLGARASIGNYVYNNVQTDMGYLTRLYGSTGILWNLNQSAVDLNVLNQASLTFSDHFVKPADFLKVDHITVGYNFEELFGSFLRVYVTAQNPIVITSYDGLDPEIFSGIDNSTYPRPRTFLFGVNVEF